LNDLLQKKAFQINDEDDFEKFLDKLNQRRAADIGEQLVPSKQQRTTEEKAAKQPKKVAFVD